MSASEIPDIVLASCQYGDHRRSNGHNTFAAALVHAGVFATADASVSAVAISGP